MDDPRPRGDYEPPSKRVRATAATEPMDQMWSGKVTPADRKAIQSVVKNLDSTDHANRSGAINKAIEIINQGDPWLTALVESGVVPKLVNILGRKSSSDMKKVVEAITSITCGSVECAKIVHDAKAAPLLASLLIKGGSAGLSEMVISALANVSGWGYLSFPFMAAFIGRLVHIVQLPCLKVELLRPVSQILQNLSPDKLPVDTKILMLQAVKKLLHHWDSQVIAQTCGIIVCLCMRKPKCQVGKEILVRLIHILEYFNSEVVVPALVAVAHILAEDKSEMSAAVKAGIFPVLKNMIVEGNSNVMQAVADVLYQFLDEGNESHIHAIWKSDLIRSLIKALGEDDPGCQMSAASALVTHLKRGTSGYVKRVYDSGVLPPLCHLLTPDNEAMTSVIQEGILCLVEKIGRDKIIQVLQATGKFQQVQTMFTKSNKIKLKGSLDTQHWTVGQISGVVQSHKNEPQSTPTDNAEVMIQIDCSSLAANKIINVTDFETYLMDNIDGTAENGSPNLVKITLLPGAHFSKRYLKVLIIRYLNMMDIGDHVKVTTTNNEEDYKLQYIKQEGKQPSKDTVQPSPKREARKRKFHSPSPLIPPLKGSVPQKKADTSPAKSKSRRSRQPLVKAPNVTNWTLNGWQEVDPGRDKKVQMKSVIQVRRKSPRKRGKESKKETEGKSSSRTVTFKYIEIA